MTEPRIGCSLAFDYLTGPDRNAYHRLFGPVNEGLAVLKAHGVASIEMRMVGRAASSQQVMQAARLIMDAGLSFTIHGLLPEPTDQSLRRCYPALFPLLDHLREWRCELILTVHAYQQADGDQDELARRTVDMLRHLAQECDREGRPVRLALELNRSKAISDPSTDYASLLSMCQQVDHLRVGICWDWGHGYANCMSGLLTRKPPPAFLRRVIHTHIHGLNAAGKTHWPLTEQNVPLAEYASLLLSSGYQGVWNLELSPHRYENEPDVAGRILRSIELLAAAIDSPPRQTPSPVG